MFTEIRDAIGWVAAGLANAGFAFVKIPPFQNLPQSTQDAPRFFADCYAYLNALAASLPNEWMFRIRVVAIVLIVYRALSAA